VLSEVSRAVSTAGTAAGIAGLEPGTGALLITGVAVPGAKRRGAFVRFKLDILLGLRFLSFARADAHLWGSFRRCHLCIHNQQLKIKTPQAKFGQQAGLLIKGS